MSKLAYVVALVVLLAPTVFAQALDSDSHIVTVTVQSIDDVEVSNAAVNLIITINPGTGQGEATDNTSTLNWATNGASRRITVQTNLATINYPLYVQAGAISGTSPVGAGGSRGTAGGEVQLSTTAQSLITGISFADGNCNLTYRATATVAVAPGTETHNVTYTLTTP
ncbi:MAG: hypothetical protein ACUVX8_01550 [Candidatus Zipacnadales bacterium]